MPVETGHYPHLAVFMMRLHEKLKLSFNENRVNQKAPQVPEPISKVGIWISRGIFVRET